MKRDDELAVLIRDPNWFSLPQSDQDYRRHRAADFIEHHCGNPVAWLLTDKSINSLQVDTVHEIIGRAWAAHHVDLILRINGKDERYQADWLKHLTRSQHDR